MCTVSMIGDQFTKTVPDRWPWTIPNTQPWVSTPPPTNPGTTIRPAGPTQEEFDDLKRELEALKNLLKAAKIYDEKTGQPDCEVDEKVDLIKKLAKLVGVDMSEIFTAQ